MKHAIRNALVTVLGIGLVGCEWSGSGDSDSWNSRFDFANFSGNYRGTDGYLVSQYTAVPVARDNGDTDGITYVPVQREPDGTAPANQLVINGRLDQAPIKAGSTTILFGEVGEFRDDGTGKLSGSYEASGLKKTGSGTIDYDTGVWTLVLTEFYLLSGNQPIWVNYARIVRGGTTVAVTTNSPGSSGITVIAFNVQQVGNRISITDNNGSVYEGKFISIATSGGTSQDTANPTFSNGDQVIGQFEASGTSAANVKVRIVGSFQATIANVRTSQTTTTMSLTDRRVLGTWIEDGGKTGDINGVTESVDTSSTTGATTTP
jgi:hypothetical protein